MRCGICHATLTRKGTRLHEYRDDSGRVVKTRRSPTYQPCPRIDDPVAHPALVNRSGPWAKSGTGPRYRTTTRTRDQQIQHAEAEAARYLGNYNEELEAGRTKGAENMLARSQHWLDRANDLRGWGDGGET